MSSWFDDNGNGTPLDAPKLLTSVEPELLFGIIDAGALLSIGKTSDGGALGVTVTVDGRWRREYFRDADELTAWLAEALPAVTSARSSAGSSSGQGQRQRRPRSA